MQINSWGLSEAGKAEVWVRWGQRESLKSIGQLPNCPEGFDDVQLATNSAGVRKMSCSAQCL